MTWIWTWPDILPPPKCPLYQPSPKPAHRPPARELGARVGGMQVSSEEYRVLDTVNDLGRYLSQITYNRVLQQMN